MVSFAYSFSVPVGYNEVTGGRYFWGGTEISATLYDRRLRALSRSFDSVALYFHFLIVALIVAGPRAQRERQA